MNKSAETAFGVRISVLVGAAERRQLLERAAAATVERGRPVSLSEITRETLRAGLEAQRPPVSA